MVESGEVLLGCVSKDDGVAGWWERSRRLVLSEIHKPHAIWDFAVSNDDNIVAFISYEEAVAGKLGNATVIAELAD